MKILYIFEKYPGTYQMYIYNLINLLKNKISLNIMTYSKHKESDIEILSYGIKDFFQRLCFYLRISKYKSKDIKYMMKYDIVHLQHSFLFSKVIPLFDFQNRPKIIITLRGGDTYVKPWVDKRWINFYQVYGTKIDAFITMSQHQKDYLKKWGIKEEKIFVSPISFNESQCKIPKYPNKNKLKLISAFRLTWEKNIVGVIFLSLELKKRQIDFVYDVYGDGADLAKLLFLIDKFQLNNYIFVKGKVENNLLIDLYSHYDFTVQLSLSESLSMSIIESQSQGTPCVVSNVGGLPEAVIPDESAIVSDFNNYDFFAQEIIKVYSNESLYFEFSSKGISFVKNQFSNESECKRLISIYNSVLNSNTI